MSIVSPDTDMTSISGLLGNQTVATVSTLPDTPSPTHVILWGWVVSYALFTLIMMGGNGLVIFAVFRYQFLQTITNVFVVGVAAADVTFGITGMMKIVDLVSPHLLAGYGSCLLRLSMGIINGVMTGTMLLCIACERCIGIFLPLHYSRLVTLYRVRVSLLLCITTPLAVLIPSIVFGNRWHKDLPCIFFIVMPPWLCCLICGWLLFCIVSMLTIYICILRTSVRLQKQVVPCSAEHPHPSQSNLKKLLNLFTIVLLFVVCLSPYLVVSIVICFDPILYLQNTALMRAYVGLLMLYMLNSLVNPFVYAVRFRSFTVAFKLLFKLIKDEDKATAIESTK